MGRRSRIGSPPGGRRLGWLALVAGGYIAVAYLLLLALPILARQYWVNDLFAYYFAAARVRAGWPLYPQVAAGPLVDMSMPYLYPPFLAAGLALLPIVSYATATALTAGVLVASLLAYGAVLGRLARGRWTWAGSLVGVLAVVLVPGTNQALLMLQLAPVLWVLFGLALVHRRARWPCMAGVALVKPFTVPAMLVALIAEPRHVVIGVGLVLVAATGLSVVAMGPARLTHETVVWLGRVAPMLAQGSSNDFNIAPLWFAIRGGQTLGWLPASGPLPGGVRMALAIFAFTGPLAVGWAARRWPAAVRYGAVTVAALLCVPYLLPHYLQFVLAPMAAAIGERLARSSLRAVPYPHPIANANRVTAPQP